MIIRIDDASLVSSKTKNINKVDLDMSSHSGKSQATTIVDNLRTRDISLLKDKNISKGTQEMLILQKYKSMKDNSLPKDKHLPRGDSRSSKDKLLPK